MRTRGEGWQVLVRSVCSERCVVPNVKKIIFDWPVRGQTVYCVIRREANGHLLDDATGAFAPAPADPFVHLTENSFIRGRYELLESRTAWSDGHYSVAVYVQSGAAPNPAVDELRGSGEIFIQNDLEITPSMVFGSVCLVDTTIAALTSQTVWTLSAGSPDNDAYNNMQVIIEKAHNPLQKCWQTIKDYTGATRTVELQAAPGVFTIAVGDKVKIVPPGVARIYFST